MVFLREVFERVGFFLKNEQMTQNIAKLSSIQRNFKKVCDRGAQWLSGRVLDLGLKLASLRLTGGTVWCP